MKRDRFKKRFRPCTLFLVLGLFCLDAMSLPAGAQAEAPSLFRGSPKQREQILARILSREGRLAESLRLYQRLRKKYPHDLDIWADYVETLINARRDEEAWRQLNAFLEEAPADSRAVRLAARLYGEQRRYGEAASVLEKQLQMHRSDPGLWSDYAWMRQMSGDWPKALDAFCRVLEADPENEAALQAVHDILRTHRPRLEAGHRTYSQAADTETRTAWLRYHMPFNGRMSARIDLEDIREHRPEGPIGPEIDEFVRRAAVSFQRRISSRTSLLFKLGYHSGFDDRVEWGTGLEFSGPSGLHLSALWSAGEPWTDPLEAAPRGGWSNRFLAVAGRNFAKAWYVSLSGEYETFYVDGRNHYGTQRSLLLTVARKLWATPDVSVGYLFYRSLFDYENDQDRTIPMIPSESVHAIFINGTYQPCRYFSFSLEAAYRHHFVRSLDSYAVRPTLSIRLGNRIRATVSYEYASESVAALGGITRTLDFRIQIIL